MSASTGSTRLPRWADVVLLPIVCLGIALLAAAAVVAMVGESPAEVMGAMVGGAFGSLGNVSYTLYYATTFIFTGLAVAVAFHGGLFNIGGEGQAVMGGLGCGLVALWLSASLPAWVMLPLMLLCGMAFGMLWAAVPAYLQAYRGSHVVITTIMFNFIASAVLGYLLDKHLRPKGMMAVESAPFAASAHLPSMQEALAWLGLEWPESPLNISFFLALLACLGVYLLVWRTRAGFRIRAVGSSPSAAEYAGIHAKHQIILSMVISGALAGMVSMNEIAGVNGKLLLDYVAGAGFTGIAVSLMGRSHPVGIILASVLFGALFQGGAEVAFATNGRISRDMVLMLQGFIVLFSGAMAYAIEPLVAAALRLLRRLWVKPVKGAPHG